MSEEQKCKNLGPLHKCYKEKNVYDEVYKTEADKKKADDAVKKCDEKYGKAGGSIMLGNLLLEIFAVLLQILLFN